VLGVCVVVAGGCCVCVVVATGSDVGVGFDCGCNVADVELPGDDAASAVVADVAPAVVAVVAGTAVIGGRPVGCGHSASCGRGHTLSGSAPSK